MSDHIVFWMRHNQMPALTESQISQLAKRDALHNFSSKTRRAKHPRHKKNK